MAAPPAFVVGCFGELHMLGPPARESAAVLVCAASGARGGVWGRCTTVDGAGAGAGLDDGGCLAGEETDAVAASGGAAPAELGTCALDVVGGLAMARSVSVGEMRASGGGLVTT